MSRRRSLRRALLAALAATTLAAPAAVAKPIDVQPIPHKQDLRMPDTRDQAEGYSPDLRYDARTGSLAGTTSPSQKPAAPDNDNSVPPLALILLGVGVAAGGAGIATTARRRSRVAV